MTPLNNHTIIKPIDNTDDKKSLYLGIFQPHVYSSTIKTPNKGIVVKSNIFETGKEIFFKSSQIPAKCDGNYIIPDKQIFKCGDDLFLPGIICEAVAVKQEHQGFHFKEQSFFFVLETNVKSIKKGNIVIINPYTSTRYNDGENVRYFIDKNNVMVTISEDGIFPGPDFIFLEEMLTQPFVNFFSKKSEAHVGKKGRRAFLYTYPQMELTLEGKKHAVVFRNQVLGTVS